MSFPKKRTQQSSLAPLKEKIWERPLWIVFLLLLPLFIRIAVVSNGSTFSLLLQTILGAILADAPLFFLLFAIFALPSFIKNRLSIGSIRLMMLFLLIFYFADVLVYMLFAKRLILSDFLKFYQECFHFFVDNISIRALFLLLAMAGFILLFAKILFSPRTSTQFQTAPHRRTLLFFAIASLFQLFFTINGKDNYIHKWEYSNFILYNIDMISEQREYSKLFKNNFVPITFEEQCVEIPPEKKKIVFLNVESLSSFQSALFSGLKDWTPEIDRIARESRWYPNFFSNGFQTEDAKIAMLTGDVPIYPPASFTRGGGTSYSNFYNHPQTLPHFLKEAGYRSIYLGGYNLSFSNTKNWLTSCGFEKIIGGDDPRFNGDPRYVFQSVADQRLLEETLSLLQEEEKKEGPFFLFVMTVTNHTPFIDPESRKHSSEKTIRYSDRVIGRFYDQLRERGFFEDGILIIVGDHRSMVPTVPGEVELFGERGSAAIPLIVVSGEPHGERVEGIFQQTDLYNGIKSMVTGRRCTSIWRGDPLAKEPISPRYVIHRRGDDRSAYSLFSKEGDLLIKINGDNTKAISSDDHSPEIEALVVNRINSRRIKQRGESYQD